MQEGGEAMTDTVSLIVSIAAVAVQAIGVWIAYQALKRK